MRKRYVVSTENDYWRFRWPWRARAHFRAVKQHEPGEVVILAKLQSRGQIKILAERFAPVRDSFGAEAQ